MHPALANLVANMPLAVNVSTPKLSSGLIISFLLGIVIGMLVRGRFGG